MKILKNEHYKKVEKIKCKDLFDYSCGNTPKKELDNYNGDIPWVNISDLGNKYLYDTSKKINDNSKVIEKDSLLISFKLSVGVCSINKVPVSSNEAIIRIEPSKLKKDISIESLYYLLPKAFIKNSSKNGLGANVLTTDVIKNIEIVIPNDLKKITDFLSTYENKLEKIKNLLEKIEIRNQYYADKLLSGELTLRNGKIVANSTTLKKNFITTLFDLKMGETILSENISNIKINETDLPVYSATEETKIFGYIEINKVKKILNENDIILAARGNSIGALKFTEEMKTSTQTTIQLVSKTKYSSYLVYKYLQNNRDRLFIAQGAAIPQITIDSIKNIEIPLVTNNEIEIYLKKLDLEKEKVEKLLKLEEQRFEWLSDKLLSGEYIIEE